MQKSNGKYETNRINESIPGKPVMTRTFLHDTVTLHDIVSNVSASSLSYATKKNSFIINDIPIDLQAITDEQMVATVFGALLNVLITHTNNTCIRVSAKLYGRIVVIQLKETCTLDSSIFAHHLRQVQQLAEKIGGTISISNNQGDATTIAFSFLNNLPVAV